MSLSHTIEDGVCTITFADPERAVAAVAAALRERYGVGPGDRVAILAANCPEWIVSFFAATRIGALFMPFSAAYKPAELRKALRLGDVQVLLASSEAWHGGSYLSFLHDALPVRVIVATLCP